MSLHHLVPDLTDPILVEGLLQVAAASTLVVVVLVMVRLRQLDLEGELATACVRGFLQVLAIGSVVGLLLSVPLLWSAVVLAGMTLAAAWISRGRAEGLSAGFTVPLVAIAAGAGTTIVAMTATGAIRPSVRNLVPVGSMIIYASMKTASLAFDRFESEIGDHRDEIEAGLSLGGPPEEVARPHLRQGVRASLIPVVDSLRSLGFVWIPGMMAGMILSGAHPLYAAEYQFVIMAMVFSASGITAVASGALVGRAIFTDAAQLRPGT